VKSRAVYLSALDFTAERNDWIWRTAISGNVVNESPHTDQDMTLSYHGRSVSIVIAPLLLSFDIVLDPFILFKERGFPSLPVTIVSAQQQQDRLALNVRYGTIEGQKRLSLNN